MIIKKPLLKTFLLYGIGLLGALYFTLSYFVWHAFFWHRNEWGVELGHLGVISVVSFLLCLFAVGLAITKLWSASKGDQTRSKWVYPSIAFVLLTSAFLLFFNLLIASSFFLND
ncbi:hypothetical protein OA067_04270 [Gammaproteobacteria bacterium]|nr:hypothetical protein [Gammaproteobacteria bacterium]|tara:strand:- start:129 stop:470 length:342 start_codon:yes stop_codon:yes gene_type:complete